MVWFDVSYSGILRIYGMKSTLFLDLKGLCLIRVHTEDFIFLDASSALISLL